MSETTVVFDDHVARVVVVRTIAADEWRAAVQLSGELDAGNADVVRRELTTHLDAGRRALRVDARRVSFIDSTVIGVLVDINERCVSVHGTLIITGASPMLLRVLAVSGLDQILLVDRAGN